MIEWLYANCKGKALSLAGVRRSENLIWCETASVSRRTFLSAHHDGEAASCTTSRADSIMASSLVSVIIPVRNVAPYLLTALKSAVLQTHRPIELSIFEDASTDDSLHVAQQFVKSVDDDGITIRLSCWQCKDQAIQQREKASYICTCPSPKAEGNNKGIGNARNTAVYQSTGSHLCMLDADDIMQPTRIAKQLASSQHMPNAIIGSQVTRLPASSTHRYTAWINGMSQQQLSTHRFKEVTLITPTWFLPRTVFDKAGGFPPDLAEDLYFLHRHLTAFQQAHGHFGERAWIDPSSQPLHEQPSSLTSELQAKRPKPSHDEVTPVDACVSATPSAHQATMTSTSQQATDPKVTLATWPELRSDVDLREVALFRINEELTIYRHREGSGSYRVSQKFLRAARAKLFQEQVLTTEPWQDGFTIWGAGRNGRQFYQQLSLSNKAKVKMFVDVDPKKIGTDYPDHGPDGRGYVRSIPVHALDKLAPPFVTCVSLDRTQGQFEANLLARQAREGVDYFTFS
eukprot:m.60587 g.60587  ORF g.60587 m.60587 type:complete len:515 (+) comp13853_c0_seq5:24-1568(+)